VVKLGICFKYVKWNKILPRMLKKTMPKDSHFFLNICYRLCGFHWGSNLLLDTPKCRNSTTRETSVCSILCWCYSLSRIVLCLPYSPLSLRMCRQIIQQVGIFWCRCHTSYPDGLESSCFLNWRVGGSDKEVIQLAALFEQCIMTMKNVFWDVAVWFLYEPMFRGT
jgi:hypothetical protein